MGVDDIPRDLRTGDFFAHIDMGFINRRLALSALPAPTRQWYMDHRSAGTDHLSELGNDHLLTTMLLDVYREFGAPTLLEALAEGAERKVFCSTQKLEPCPEVYSAPRVTQKVVLPVEFDRPIALEYHTKHIVSDTGKMTLAEGHERGYVEAIFGLLHKRPDRFEIEPVIMGAPTYDHPRNKDASPMLPWVGSELGEILAEDIDEFARLTETVVSDATDWISAMERLPEERVKNAIAKLLKEPTKKDWGGELNDHFSASVHVNGRRKTAAFMFKGPANFRPMTLEMCGKRADQIFRLAGAPADVLVLQHSHLITEAVRETLRAFAVAPHRPRKYCLIDGQATYRILKAYGFLDS